MAVAASTPDPEPDWSGIRAAAVAIGVRAAARRASAHLPTEEQARFVERVMKRSSREGWITAKEEAQSSVVPRGQPLSAPVRNGADTLSSELADDSKQTRLSLARSARHLAQQAENAPLEQAGDALQVGKLAQLVHGWAGPGGTTSQAMVVNISMLSAAPDHGPIVDLE